MKILKLAGLAVFILIAALVLAGVIIRSKSGGAAAERMAQPKPPLPIILTFRKALMGSGAVAHFKNTSNRTFSFEAVIESAATHQKKTTTLVLDPGKEQEIGHLQGWAFAPGDTVTMSSAGFETLKTTLQPF